MTEFSEFAQSFVHESRKKVLAQVICVKSSHVKIIQKRIDKKNLEQARGETFALISCKTSGDLLAGKYVMTTDDEDDDETIFGFQ